MVKICHWLSLSAELIENGLVEATSRGTIFWTPGLPDGVLSNHPCPSVVRPSVGPSLDISETVHQFFLIFCMKLGHHKGTKVTEPDF